MLFLLENERKRGNDTSGARKPSSQGPRREQSRELRPRSTNKGKRKSLLELAADQRGERGKGLNGGRMGGSGSPFSHDGKPTVQLRAIEPFPWKHFNSPCHQEC